VPCVARQLLAKLVEFNGTVGAAGGTPCTPEEVGWLTEGKKVLEVPTLFHSSKVDAACLAPFSTKILPTWPPSHIFPALDYLRIAVTHPQGAALCAGMGGALLPPVLGLATGGGGAAADRAPVLTAGRVLFNMLKQPPTRAACLRRLGGMVEACAALLRFPHASVVLTAGVLIHNLALAVSDSAGEASSASPADAAALCAAIGAAMDAAEEDVQLNSTLALGTLLLIDAEGAKVWLQAARATAGLRAKVEALQQKGKTEKAAREVLRLFE